MNPQVLVMDEPTVGLDRRSAQMVEEVMRSYHRQGRSVVFVTHDMDLVARLAENVLVLSRGRLLFQGSKADLFRDDVIVKQAGLMIVGHLYEMRQDVGYSRVFEVPMNSKYLVEKYRKQSFV